MKRYIYLVYPAFRGYGEKPKEFTSYEKAQKYVAEQIRKGEILTIRADEK